MTTKIRYSIPPNTDNYSVLQNVTLKIYDILGTEVATLVNEYKPAGVYEVEFNIHSNEGLNLANGVYFYRLQVGSLFESKKMTVIK
ncbi:MAG: T9SS type A sorting domain-containing protein [Ignavibacterium sp.]